MPAGLEATERESVRPQLTEPGLSAIRYPLSQRFFRASGDHASCFRWIMRHFWVRIPEQLQRFKAIRRCFQLFGQSSLTQALRMQFLVSLTPFSVISVAAGLGVSAAVAFVFAAFWPRLLSKLSVKLAGAT